MRKFFILLTISLINLNFLNGPAKANPCDEIDFSWNRYELEGFATFKFKSRSSSTIKIYDMRLLTSNDQVITTFTDNFYMQPFGAVTRQMSIRHLNNDVIKSASFTCVKEEKKSNTSNPSSQKKTGTAYVYSVKWQNNSTMGYNDCGITGVSCNGWVGVSTNKNSANIGDKITVYNKNKKVIETFEVKKIYIEYDKNQCWLSKQNKEQFKDYLSIQNCVGY